MKKSVIDILKNWGHNPGEFEELISKIAANEGFAEIEVEKIDDTLSFQYRLNETGRKIAAQWAEKNNVSPMKDRGHFYDEDPDSVENAVRLLGIKR